MGNLIGEQIRIEYIPLSQVVLWDENPKEHDVGAIAESIQRYGFRDPVGFDATLGALVEGHGRAHVLHQMQRAGDPPPRGIALDADGEWYVPMLFGVDAESVAAAKAYAIDHNNLTLSGNFEVWDVAKIWDEAAYTALLQEMAGDGVFPVSVDGDDLDALLREFGEEDEPPEDPGAQMDRAEELNEKWQVAEGDLWEIPSAATPGKAHRLLCGDSTKQEDVARLMGGERADAVVTDPPYGIEREGIANDSEAHLRGLFDKALDAVPIERGVIVAFQSTRLFIYWLDALRAHGAKFERMLWLYKASQCTFPWRGWLLKSEAILVATLGAGHWTEVNPYAHDCYSLSEVSGELKEGEGHHTTVKPLAVVEDLVQRVCGSAQLVYDPFIGSGTTMIACERTDRLCYGLELEPKYCAVALERLAGLGLEPGRVEGA